MEKRKLFKTVLSSVMILSTVCSFSAIAFADTPAEDERTINWVEPDYSNVDMTNYHFDLPEDPCADVHIDTQQDNQRDEQIAQETQSEEIIMQEQMGTRSIANPKKARVIVATNAYSSPDPSVSATVCTLPTDTNVWVVEKVLRSSTGKYYYYAGFTYNNKSMRGYLSEDNVYVGTSRLLPANVTAQTIPGNMKAFTSTSGTVYYGPGTTYASIGSIGSITINMIRTEGDYNFISYQDSNGKYRRGFLHCSKLTGNWADLSEDLSELYDGKYIKFRNLRSDKYLTIDSTTNSSLTCQDDYYENDPTISEDDNEYMRQVFRVDYISSEKCYKLTPQAISTRPLTIQSSSTIERPNRNLVVYDWSNVSNQKFWIVSSGGNGKVKIVPVSTYGNMTLTDRNDTDKRVGQFYTDTTSSNRDLWQIVFRSWLPNVTGYDTEINNGCWLDASCTMGNQLRTANGFAPSTLTGEQVQTAVGDTGNGGNATEEIAAVKCFMKDSLNVNATSGPNFSISAENDYLNEINLLSYLQSNKSLMYSMGFTLNNQVTDSGHIRVIAGYQWNENIRKYEYHVIDDGNHYLVSYNYLRNGNVQYDFSNGNFGGESDLTAGYAIYGIPFWRRSVLATRN